MESSKHANTDRDGRLLGSRPPGVYYELFFEKKVQPAFRTGVPVFVGFANWLSRESHHAPRIHYLDSWPQFQHFQTLRESYLGYAVRGFFENGGARCAVVPVQSGPQKDMANALMNVFQPGGAMDDLEDIDLVCVPDAMLPSFQSNGEAINVQSSTLEHCLRMGDRFAILDGFPRSHTPELASVDVDNKAVHPAVAHWQNLPPEHGALYYPWVSVRKLSSSGKTGSSLSEMPCDRYARLNHGDSGAGSARIQPAGVVPPCGHIAGIYTRSDARIGVHKAPANELVEDVLKLEVDFTDDELAELNNSGVNCLRAIRGGGIRVWGARTLSGHPQWAYVNVRRLFLTLTRWIKKNMDDVVYETNNPDLWDRVRRRLADYCRNLFDQGALKGNSPEQAFYVKCDSETNTREYWEAGEVIAEVGLAPVAPLEFIVVRITQSASTTTVSGLSPF